MITLKYLEVHNFKGLRSVALTFPKQGNVLIEGHNEAGKSTLFEAVYVALYGKPLVGEDATARQDEVIQYGQSQATVQLLFNVSQQELTVERNFSLGKPQQALLTIRRPGMQLEVVSRVRAVNDRILKELGNLDGDSLRNSCFVEQKELGRIETLSLAQREQAIQKLLGLERLTQLIDFFKFRREQERELGLAERYLTLAKLQDEVRIAALREAELTERLDAVKVAIQLRDLETLEGQKKEAEKRLDAIRVREQEAREILNRCLQIKEQLRQCDQIDGQLSGVSYVRNELDRVAKELRRLETIERNELPAARAYLDDVSAAAEVVAQVILARKNVQEAEGHVREMQRNVQELKQAEAERQRKEEEGSQAQSRVAQRQKALEVEQQHFELRRKELDARRVRLEQAQPLMARWESACALLQSTRQEIAAAESREQELLRLRQDYQRREAILQETRIATARAEQEMQQTAENARLSTAYEVMASWVRLKGVELALSGHRARQTQLLAGRQEVERVLATAQARRRVPLLAGIVLAALAIVTLALGLVWSQALILFACVFVGAVGAWLWFFQMRKGVQQQKTLLAQNARDFQQLDIQRQEAIRAGGDPVALGQSEEQLLAVGMAVPPNLEAGGQLQAELSKRLGGTQSYHGLQKIAQSVREKHILLMEQLKQAQLAADRSEQDVIDAQKGGNPSERLNQLKTQAEEQAKIARANEEIVKQAIRAELPWPTDSHALQMSLSTCQTELRAADNGQQQQVQLLTRAIQEAKVDKERIEKEVTQAQERFLALRTTDPAGQLAGAQESLGQVRAFYLQQNAVAQPLLLRLKLNSEIEVEPERGRAEARVQALEKQLETRPARQQEDTQQKAKLAEAVTIVSTKIEALLAALHTLIAIALPSLPQASDTDDRIAPRYEQALIATSKEIREVIQKVMHTLDEQGTKKILEEALGEQGKIQQQKNGIESKITGSQETIHMIFLSRKIVGSSAYTYESIVACWELVAHVSAREESQLAQNLEEESKHLYAVHQQESQLIAELQHPGTILSIVECQQKVEDLNEERQICQCAIKLLREAHDRIARRVLPITERNMQPLLQQLTGGRYCDVRLTPEASNGQQGEMDYRIRVWDPAAGRYVAKNIFSGGTRDQCSLALRLAFALATLPQELGVAPGFIFLDEPLSSFDNQRAQALVELITVGTIAQQFPQVILISHQHAFNREAFHYHVRMEGGQIIESDLPDVEISESEETQLQPVAL